MNNERSLIVYNYYRSELPRHVKNGVAHLHSFGVLCLLYCNLKEALNGLTLGARGENIWETWSTEEWPSTPHHLSLAWDLSFWGSHPFDMASDNEGIDIPLMRTVWEVIQHLDIHVTLRMIWSGVTWLGLHCSQWYNQEERIFFKMSSLTIVSGMFLPTTAFWHIQNQKCF